MVKITKWPIVKDIKYFDKRKTLRCNLTVFLVVRIDSHFILSTRQMRESELFTTEKSYTFLPLCFFFSSLTTICQSCWLLILIFTYLVEDNMMNVNCKIILGNLDFYFGENKGMKRS